MRRQKSVQLEDARAFAAGEVQIGKGQAPCDVSYREIPALMAGLREQTSLSAGAREAARRCPLGRRVSTLARTSTGGEGADKPVSVRQNNRQQPRRRSRRAIGLGRGMAPGRSSPRLVLTPKDVLKLMAENRRVGPP
jgi:hypothetical protein